VLSPLLILSLSVISIIDSEFNCYLHYWFWV